VERIDRVPAVVLVDEHVGASHRLIGAALRIVRGVTADLRDELRYRFMRQCDARDAAVFQVFRSGSGSTLRGSIADPGRVSYDHATAQRVADKLPEAVEVYYNPEDPGDAYLERAARGLGTFLLIVGAVGFLISAGMLIAELTG
jgi:hypothetical protein